MKNVLVTVASVAFLTGCATCNSYDADDPVVGNWGLKLGYEDMSAGHMIVSRDADGVAKASVLWRWASPEPMKNTVLPWTTDAILPTRTGNLLRHFRRGTILSG